jgi:hypothetical protein
VDKDSKFESTDIGIGCPLRLIPEFVLATGYMVGKIQKENLQYKKKYIYFGKMGANER